MENEIMYIKLDDIIPNRFQPREVFDEEALNKLADSIRQHGVIEPILVRPVSNKYEIVAGERRYKASVLAGLTKIPAMVRQLDDKESSIVAFIENEHRADVSAIEEARTMERILNNNNMTQEELAKELGVNQSTIANKLRLLNLPNEVQESLMRNEISERHARSLLSVKDEVKQIELLNKIKEKRMSVRELDSEIKNMNGNMNFNEQRNDGMNGINLGVPNMGQESKPFNPNDYINNVNNPIPVEPVTPSEPQADPGFMSFLNSYDNNNPVSSEPMELKEQTPTATPEGNDFRNILNSYNNNPQEPAPEPGFMDFLNNYDNNNPVPTETPQAPVQEPVAAPSDDGFMSFLNNYDNNNPVPAEAPQTQPEPSAPVDADPGFMSFLNNYDNNNPVPTETPQAPVQEPVAAPADDGFMSFLNNYDNNNPVPAEAPQTQEPSTPVDTDPGFMNFLNNYDANNTVTEEVKPTVETPNTSNYELPPIESNLYDGFTDTLTTPTSTTPTPQYVEDSANYVDISKENKITDVDTILNKLGNVVKEIKEKSIFKVDTEEINYDDIYQITIKIDKRDF